MYPVFTVCNTVGSNDTYHIVVHIYLHMYQERDSLNQARQFEF